MKIMAYVFHVLGKTNKYNKSNILRMCLTNCRQYKR